MSWRHVYKNEIGSNIHYTINNRLEEGYYLLEDVIKKCNNIKKTLDETIDFGSDETKVSDAPPQSLSALHDVNVKNVLRHYISDMDIYVSYSNIEGSSLGDGSLEINTSDSDSVSEGIEKYVNMHVMTSTHSGSAGRVSITEGLDNLTSRVNSFVGDTKTGSIKKFATHLNVFIESKYETSQPTDFHDDIIEVYGSGIKKISLNSCEEIMAISCESETEQYLSHMNKVVPGIEDSDKYFKWFNSENILAYMCTTEKNIDTWSTYTKAVKSLISDKQVIIDILEGLTSKADLQIAAHETEYKTNSDIIDIVSAINLDDNADLGSQLDNINNAYYLNDKFIDRDYFNILNINETKYNTPDNGDYDDVYDTIMNQYINGELSASEIFNLCIEYPYLNRYIDQYYIENFSTLKPGEYGTNLTKIYNINCKATFLLDQGVVEIDNIVDINGNRFQFDATFKADELHSSSEIKNCDMIVLDFIEGDDAALEVYRTELELQYSEQFAELKEFDSIFSTGEEDSEYYFSSGDFYDDLIAAGMEKAEDITLDTIKGVLSVFPYGSQIFDLTVEQAKQYFNDMEEFRKLEAEMDRTENALTLGGELESIGLAPSVVSSVSIDGKIVDTNYTATPEMYEIYSAVEILEQIYNPNTSEVEKTELQESLIEIAHNNGTEGYGVLGNGELEYDISTGGISDIDDTYNLVIDYDNEQENNVEENILTSFTNKEYINDDGIFNSNNFVVDSQSEDIQHIFDIVDDFITHYDD